MGDVTAESAVVWFRTAGHAQARVEWFGAPKSRSEGPSSAQPMEVHQSPVLVTTQERDYTAKVRLTGLRSGVHYRYRVVTGRAAGEDGLGQAIQGAAGRFSTPPNPNVSQTTTFVWGSDLGGQQRCRRGEAGYAIFDRIREAKPDFAILLGDLIYADGACKAPPNAFGSDFTATTLEHFRAKHRYQRGAPALRRFLAGVPVYVTWDDHEVRNNFSGLHDPLMPDGRQALLEYWPIQVPPEDPHRLYRQIRRGADLELFILDTRQYRSRNAEADGEDKTMLGVAQRDWLVHGLRESTATWKVIASSVPLSIPKGGTLLEPGYDGWAKAPDGTGFYTELRGIVDAILQHQIDNVVWLAADVHFAQVNVYDPDTDGVGDFVEFIGGPLSAYHGTPVPPEPILGPTTLYTGAGFSNFGLVTATQSSLQVEVIDDKGVSRFKQTFAAQGHR
ncbi:MAG: alkaline phosphatase D family protein [Nitrospiraceae bacterium]